MKKLISVLLAVLLLAALCGIASADTGIGVEPGQQMPDFTVSLTDGSTATLSELLKEKDLVVLNIFASFCKPCEREFPEMEEVYQANRDRMEIVSVSGYSVDTMDVIAAYKESHGLSFPMGLTGEGLSFLTATSYPTTIMIDRNGMVGLVKVGAFVDKAEFESKVNYFLSADYNGKPLKTEQAVNYMRYIEIAIPIAALVLVIGRWGLFRKAGKKGWHSLIPLLNAYDEYSMVWKGWIGILATLCFPLGILCNIVGLPAFIAPILYAAGFVLGIPESIRLAKAFGKSTFVGVLMAIPGIKEVSRLFLGLGKAKFQAPVSDTANS